LSISIRVLPHRRIVPTAVPCDAARPRHRTSSSITQTHVIAIHRWGSVHSYIDPFQCVKAARLWHEGGRSSASAYGWYSKLRVPNAALWPHALLHAPAAPAGALSWHERRRATTPRPRHTISIPVASAVRQQLSPARPARGLSAHRSALPLLPLPSPARTRPIGVL